ncbi:Reverse transcriptase-like [Sesbania bispinosa]|nr:Reverse transcriptase-like [Sesbania bispinosa]
MDKGKGLVKNGRLEGEDIYFPNSDFLHAAHKRNGSWSWNSVLQGRNIVLKGGLWVVGDGSNINIQRDRWLPQGDLTVVADIPRDAKVAELLHYGELGWDREKIRSWFHPSTVNHILQIPLSYSRAPNRFIWPFNTNGELSVKFAYQVSQGMDRIDDPNNPSTSDLPNDALGRGQLGLPLSYKNDFHFNSKVPDPGFTLSRAMLYLNHLSNPTVQEARSNGITWKHNVSRAWRAPPPHSIKFNCDASFNRISKTAAAAIIARDHEGKTLAVSSEKEDKSIWEINHIIQDIKSLTSSLPRCGFLWTAREGNKSAHALAEAAANRESPFTSIFSIPSDVRALLDADRQSLSRELQDRPP